jgi:hypothetical protein
MKITDLMEAPPGGWLNTKAALGKADDLVRNNRLGKGLGNLNTAVSKKYGGAHGNKAPIDPAGGIDDKETDDWIAGKDTKDPKPKAPAPKGAKTLDKQPTKDPKSIDDLKPGSAYNDGTATWTWTGTDWSDGAVKLDPATGFKQFKKAKNKFVKEAPGAAAPDAQKPDPKQAQQVAQKATALKGVVGGKASGSQVAKGLDKVAAGETLPPNIIKAIAPYATAIQTMMSNPQLFGKFKALMKQAEAGQNQQ